VAGTLKRAAFLAVLLVAAAGVWWWMGGRARPVPAPAALPATLPPVRGGELVASMRGEPGVYNRYVEATSQTDLLDLLVDGRLVSVNRASDQLEPQLAESWTQSSDGLTYTLKLRSGVTFSDGVPFSSADVLFSFRALYDARVDSPLASAMRVGGKPLLVSAPDPATVVIKLPVPFAPGLRLLDNLPILPRHKLEPALQAGHFADAWTPSKPLSDIAGLGPFVLTEHVTGQRLVFTRNPHYWRRAADGTALPYLDKLTLLVVPDQNTEALRLQAGETDVMASAEIRPEDYAGFRRLADQGRLRLLDVGVGLDPNMLWFNLSPPGLGSKHPAWFGKKEFRQAISYAVDRQAIVNTVYLGAAVPISGPVSPGNRTWYSPSTPQYAHDGAKARALLASIGLSDRNGDGMLEDATGVPVRFSIVTQKGHSIRERTAAVLQEQLRKEGIAVDVVPLDSGAMQQRWLKRDYDTMYFSGQASATDPAMNADFWLSSGFFHFWNHAQRSPATDWERRIDDLMRQQTVAPAFADRQRLFAEVQRIMADELPAIYFVAPRVTVAVSERVVNPVPALQIPQLLWSADTLASTAARR
jgi:peptide/nickel transport system substrate-binding protein